MTKQHGGLRHDREAIRRRLDAGEEIDLTDALDLFDIRRSWELWPLAELRARGRVGGPLEPYTEIASEAWLHLRWTIEAGDFLVVTPEGKRVYGLRFSAREDAGVDQVPEVAPAGHVGSSDRSAHLEDPLEVFRRLAETPRPSGCPWTIEEYNTELAKAGLSVSKDKQRMPGVKIAEQGRIERGGGPILLSKALLVTRFRLVAPLGYFHEIRVRRDVAKALYRWLAVDHANLVAARREVSDRVADDLVDTLRWCFGDFAGAAFGRSETA